MDLWLCCSWHKIALKYTKIQEFACIFSKFLKGPEPRSGRGRPPPGPIPSMAFDRTLGLRRSRCKKIPFTPLLITVSDLAFPVAAVKLWNELHHRFRFSYCFSSSAENCFVSCILPGFIICTARHFAIAVFCINININLHNSLMVLRANSCSDCQLLW